METKTYRVKSPSGEVIEVRGPAGATREQIIAKARDYYEAGKEVISEDIAKVGEAVGSMSDQAIASYDAWRGKPQGFDYSTGVQDAAIRARLSLADTPDEQQAYLEQIGGPGTVVKDPQGRFALTPDGMRAAGLPPSDRPTLVDEKGITRYDVADWAGGVGPFVGGAGAGMAASGLGVLPGLLLSGAGALVGKGVQEGLEHLSGINTQPAESVGVDMLKEGGYGLLGEGVARSLRPIGRMMLAPGGGLRHFFMRGETADPARIIMRDEARELGVKPSVSNVTQAPVLGRIDELAQTLMGQPRRGWNTRALEQELQRLETIIGGSADKEAVGTAVKSAISSQRKAFSRWAGETAKQLDEMTAGQRIIPTGNFRKRLAALKAEMPREGRKVDVDTGLVDQLGNPITQQTEELGKTLGVPSESLSEFNKYLNVRENLTLKEWQLLRTELREGLSSGTLMPGVSHRFSRDMVKAADQMLDDATKSSSVPQALKGAMKKFHAQYKSRAGEFEANIVERLARDKRFAGEIPPESVVEHIIRPGEVSRTRRVMNLLPDSTKENVRLVAMRDILADATRTNPDDITQSIFSGTPFLDRLTKDYGEDHLKAIFGTELAGRLLKFARVSAYTAEKGPRMIGGLAVANIALHPWENVGQQIRLRLLEKALLNDKFLDYMTVGAKAKTLRGASDAITRLTAMAQMLLDDEVQEKE